MLSAFLQVNKMKITRERLIEMIREQLEEEDPRVIFARQVLANLGMKPAEMYDDGSAIAMLFGSRQDEGGMKRVEVHMSREPGDYETGMGQTTAFLWLQGQEYNDPAEAAEALEAYIGGKEEIQETKGNKMKLTKSQLKQIIEEELKTTLDEDQGMFARGAKGAGQDEISVEKIRISPDGSFKARLTSAALEKPLRVQGKLDGDSVEALAAGGALQAPKELTGLAKDVAPLVDKIKANYEGTEAGTPPAVEQMDKLVRSNNLEKLKDEITDHWNALLLWHQRSNVKLDHSTTSTFNTINTLLRKMR